MFRECWDFRGFILPGVVHQTVRGQQTMLTSLAGRGVGTV
jgi:hypothetical protein